MNSKHFVGLLKADVTDNNDDDKALQKRFGVVGPPAHPQEIRLHVWPVHQDGADAGPGTTQESILAGVVGAHHSLEVPGCLTAVPSGDHPQTHWGGVAPGDVGELDDTDWRAGATGHESAARAARGL